ncbi:hypothetical protein FB563_7104 [Streptomyces puniciscabiei]|uniref:Uncharacterized protein n=1 Tax=Streptomyces puniciscabiei TaxID=164348 RepID=A0A542TJC9_9ACTN|nr:hypothetical protein FB563_7104 [Streptomyces puniciscabiei]
MQGDVLDQAARWIDKVVAADPPATDKCGSHFCFLRTEDEPALMVPLTGSAAFGLAEELAGTGKLQAPWQVQVALNIPPYSHRPGRPHIDAGNPEPTGEPVRDTFTRRALYFRISALDHASRRNEFLQDPWLDYEPLRSHPATPPAPPVSG